MSSVDVRQAFGPDERAADDSLISRASGAVLEAHKMLGAPVTRRYLVTRERDMTAPVTRCELHEALETWGGALEARANARFDELRALIINTGETLFGRVKAMLDPVRDLPARVVQLEDSKLPERVSKLEARVFAKRRASKASRRRTR